MAAAIGPRARSIIDRLGRVGRGRVEIDRARVERAITEHLALLGLPALPFRWADSAAGGYSAARSAARSAAWSAAWSAAESAAWSAAWSAAESAARSAARSAAESAAESAARSAAKLPDDNPISRYAGIWLPFVDAFEAGLWLYWFTSTEVICVPRPALRIEGGRLHCGDGPAVEWPGTDERYFFWRGVQVPAWAIEQPELLTIERVMAERNVETRRALIGMLGNDGLLGLARARGRVVDTDTVRVRVPAFDVGEEDRLAAWIEQHGIERWLTDPPSVEIEQERTLYEIERDADQPMKLVVVHCPSSALAGEPRTYPLRARWDAKTCAEAVAGSFGLGAVEYRPLMES